MRTEHFNLESITELGGFYFKFVGHAVGGGEWWGVQLGDRTVFHLRASHSREIETIFSNQKNYPFYCSTEKDHFFFFEDTLFHVTPSLVDPLAEMIILYFARMTSKLKPEIKKIQREFGESIVKFDKLLKEKAEQAKKKSIMAVTQQPTLSAVTSSGSAGEIKETIGSPQAQTEDDEGKTERDLQKERMRERRRRLGLPDVMD